MIERQDLVPEQPTEEQLPPLPPGQLPAERRSPGWIAGLAMRGQRQVFRLVFGDYDRVTFEGDWIHFTI